MVKGNPHQDENPYDQSDFRRCRRLMADGRLAEGSGAVLHVVREETHPQMRRVRDRDGRQSDMVNLSQRRALPRHGAPHPQRPQAIELL
jgi:hypothetical protein